MHYEDKKTGFKFDAVSGVPKENTVEAFEELFSANKATEEGELPELPQEIEVGGEGWDFEDFKSQKTFSVDHMHEYARQAIAADRASRQVANKAEVEPVGASTVLTDERIAFEAWYFPKFGPQKMLGDSDQYHMPSAQGAWQAWQARSKVAAQAGQVAVPDDPMDSGLPCDIKVGNVTIRKGCKLRTLVARMESLHRMAMAALPVVTPEQRAEFDSMFPRFASISAAAPSPAKESK